MKPPANPTVPRRAETLEILRLMGDHEPILQLGDEPDGYGMRWTLHGQQVQPGIARYLMDAGYLTEKGKTQFGARRLMLTESGRRFREEGTAWWSGLGFLEKLRIRLFG